MTASISRWVIGLDYELESAKRMSDVVPRYTGILPCCRRGSRRIVILNPRAQRPKPSARCDLVLGNDVPLLPRTTHGSMALSR